MADKITLKKLFGPGTKPRAEDFASLIDSFFLKGEGINPRDIAGLYELLDAKLDSNATDTLLAAFNNAISAMPKPWTVVDGYEEWTTPSGDVRVLRKITGYIGGTGDAPNENIGKYYTDSGALTSDKNEAADFSPGNPDYNTSVLNPNSTTKAETGKSIAAYQAVTAFENRTLSVVGNVFNPALPSEDGHYFFNSSGVVGDLDGWSVSGYLQVRAGTKYSASFKRFVMFYDASGNFISSDIDANVYSFTTPDNAAYIRVDFPTNQKNTIVLTEGVMVPQHDYLAYNKANYSQILEPEWKRIYATRNSENFNSIRNLANALEPSSSYWNRYEIFVNNGEWPEMDWQGWGDFVRIIGQNMLSTKIICDGLWSDSKYKTDDLFPYEAYRNKTFSQVWNDLGSPRFLHIIFAKKNIHIENVSFEGINLKYIVHCDNPGYKSVFFKNIAFKQRGCNYIMGNGINGGQKIIIENFIADNDPNPIKTDHAFYHHTWGNQSAGSLLHLINGTFKNGGIALLGEAGSEHQDDVIIENCKGDKMKIMWSVPEWTPGKSLWQNPATGQLETNPTKVPYCITVWDKNTRITLNEDNKSFTGWTDDVRPGRNSRVI